MWIQPWGYRESLIVTAGLAAGGWAIQLAQGPFNFYFLHRPVNYLICGLLALAAFLSLAFKNKALVRWLGGVPLSVCLMTGLLLFSLVMGIIPQMVSTPPDGDLIIKLGLTRVTASWPFALLYLTTLLSLGLIVARRLFKGGRRNIIFSLNHLGLWLVLAAAGFGAADRERHVMHVQEGQLEWRVYSDHNEILELPLAIRLDDFIMEEYPPKLAVIDRESGLPLPENRPAFLQVDPQSPQGRLLDWDINIKNYIYQAVPAGNSTYARSANPAATQAVEVLAQNRVNKVIAAGWLAGGNSHLPVLPLVLDDKQVLVMAQPEPKSFISKIKVYSKDGREAETDLEVNKPLRISGWTIYQYGYDTRMGRLSGYSSFELVYDPWLNMAYIGFILWALGSIGLIYLGRPKNPAAKGDKSA